MGVYDTLPGGSQVKCWDCDMTTKQVGNVVPELAPEYMVLLREGGYVHVLNGVIAEIVEDGVPRYPEHFTVPCFDKYGTQVYTGRVMVGLFAGLFGMDDEYFFS